jgi:hypothetical protein
MNERFRDGAGEILFPLCVLLPVAIPISLLYRLYVFLRHGYNPTISIDRFIPQTGTEFSWKGLEIIYDAVVSLPAELVLVLVWGGLVYFTCWVTEKK